MSTWPSLRVPSAGVHFLSFLSAGFFAPGPGLAAGLAGGALAAPAPPAPLPAAAGLAPAAGGLAGAPGFCCAWTGFCWGAPAGFGCAWPGWAGFFCGFGLFGFGVV